MAKPERAIPTEPLPARRSRLREWGQGLGGALPTAIVLALVIRIFVVQAFKIPSGSMLPTLQIGDHILVNKFIYGPRLEIPFTQITLGQLPGLRHPRPGDVVVFIWPKDRSKDFIKRVIATEGQTVEVRNKQVLIDSKPWDDPHATFGPAHGGGAPGDNYGPFTVPAGHIFVMGDNRDQSYDSRFWGPVPLGDVKGLALVIYWSWDGEPSRWVRSARCRPLSHPLAIRTRRRRKFAVAAALPLRRAAC
jgi:signal peptidase I